MQARTCTALLVASLATSTLGGSSERGRRNVLLIGVDDLRPELNCYGEDPIPGTHSPPMHSPNFDKLAARSLVLHKNYVQFAVCAPSRASLLTGRRPDRTRTYDLVTYWRNAGGNYTTIPEYFKLHGYYSVGMGKVFHPGNCSGDDDRKYSWTVGAEYYHAPNFAMWDHLRDPHNLFHSRPWYAATPEEVEAHPLPDMQLANHALLTLNQMPERLQLHGAKNFFMAVGFHKPHLPFVFPKEMFEYYPWDEIKVPPNQLPPRDMPWPAWFDYKELRDYAGMHATRGEMGQILPELEVRNLRRAYYAAVTYIDQQVGRVLTALEESPYYDNTVVIVWGDHGWELGEHGEWCKQTNFEFAARAPMLLAVPGVTDGGLKSTMYTEHVDIFPTLVDAAFAPEEPRLPVCPPHSQSFNVSACGEGVSLMPLTANPNKPVKAASFNQYWRLGEITSKATCIIPGESCVMGYSVVTVLDSYEYRMTQWCWFNTVRPLKVDWGNCVGHELYNHTTDPGENVNIHGMPSSQSVIPTLHAMLVGYTG
eukprot:Rhum_TRINITY_DN14963_c0_g1::Rhum_TRINITY_DN14963_c0_g1_i1::g.129002::m.129002/K01136/IDS; iduronate 2-sulfatase